MNKKKRKKHSKNNEQIILKNQIKIYEEACYKTVKHKELGESKVNEIIDNQEKSSLLENILFIINFFIWPWKIHKKFELINNLYDNVLVVYISLAMQLFGAVFWLICVIGMPIAIWNSWGSINDVVSKISIGLLSGVLGSTFILAGREFSKETDSNKIYAFSSCILAFIGCIIAVIAIYANK